MKMFAHQYQVPGMPIEEISHERLRMQLRDASPRARHAVGSWARDCIVGSRIVHPDTLDIWERIA